jgi:uncharacterized DUF497 family protein
MWVFEFDSEKSNANKIKHGIDFIEAQELWADDDGIEVPALTSDEPRFGRTAFYQGRLWTAFYTHRGNRIRLFSVRRSRAKEKKIYDQKDT